MLNDWNVQLAIASQDGGISLSQTSALWLIARGGRIWSQGRIRSTRDPTMISIGVADVLALLARARVLTVDRRQVMLRLFQAANGCCGGRRPINSADVIGVSHAIADTCR